MNTKKMIRLYPRYGTSITHLPGSPTRTKQRNDDCDTNDEQRNKEQTMKNHNRLSWPQFSSPTSPLQQNINKQRTTIHDKENKTGLHSRVLYPEDAKVFERATQIVMYVNILNNDLFLIQR